MNSETATWLNLIAVIGSAVLDLAVIAVIIMMFLHATLASVVSGILLSLLTALIIQLQYLTFGGKVKA